LGFGISAALQVFVSKEQMTRALGRAGLREMLLATGFGAASSSCSYAAGSIGRSAFQKGAALIPALAFMFASTNLVVELGAVLWKELAAGFLIAGFLAALVPSDWWKALFIDTGTPFLRLIENAAVGPIIAVLSFVCSVGNIPLASLLWANGISFGGVISFIYADLLVIPLILIYRKYFGGRATFYIVLIFYISMVAAGVIVDLIFAGAGLIPQGERPVSPIEHATFTWNYTTWLDLIAISVAIWLWGLEIHSRRSV